MKISRHLFSWIAVVAFVAATLPLFARTPLKAGDKAPHFSGRDQDGDKWKLSHHAGKHVVLLYFYPKDDTAGCSAEACGLRDNMAVLKQEGVEVVGVSFDDKDSHKKFAFKYNLDFPLLADTGGHIAKAYGARMSHNKKMDRRVSFLIGLDGKIIHITDSPDPAVHLREMVAAIAKLKGVVSR
jgi:thioredoxin-dependent peroxiredoxin